MELRLFFYFIENKTITKIAATGGKVLSSVYLHVIANSNDTQNDNLTLDK